MERTTRKLVLATAVALPAAGALAAVLVFFESYAQAGDAPDGLRRGGGAVGQAEEFFAPPDLGARIAAAREIEAAGQRELVEAERGRLARREDVAVAVATLQPWFAKASTPRERSRREVLRDELVDAIWGASGEYGQSHLIAVAMARRESSLLPLVGHGERDGALGERGYFQIYPDGYAERRCAPGGCDQHDAACNARTAMCFLRECQRMCESDDPWIYVGAYGRNRCPTSRAEARRWDEVRRARQFLCEAVGDRCEEIWPG